MTPAPPPGREPLLTLDDAARRLGLHYMTVYRYVRLGRLPAEQRDGRWWVRPGDLDRLTASPPAPRRRPGAARWTGPRRRLVGRLLAGDGAGCWALVEEALAGGAAPVDVYLRLLGPALRDIGDGWAVGTLTVGDEHRATAVALRIVGRLGPRFAHRGPTTAGTVLLGGAPGDPHQLPVAMVADVLRQRGVDVVDLGANVPEPEFLGAAAALPDLRAVGISVSDDRCRARAAGVAAALGQVRPSLPVVGGGPALPARDDALALGFAEWAADAEGAAALLEEG